MLRDERLMKSTKGPDLFLGRGHFVEFLQCGLQFETRAIEHSIGSAHVANLIFGKSAPLQTHRIDAVRFRRLPDGHDIRRHVLVTAALLAMKQ